MEDVMTTEQPIDCVGVICFRGDDVLLIKRGTAPRKGEWSIPGGRIEAGETERDAALRVDAQFEDFNYRLHDYAARWISGEPQFGDDAADARFVPPSELDALGMWPKTREVIETARKSLLQK